MVPLQQESSLQARKKSRTSSFASFASFADAPAIGDTAPAGGGGEARPGGGSASRLSPEMVTPITEREVSPSDVNLSQGSAQVFVRVQRG